MALLWEIKITANCVRQIAEIRQGHCLNIFQKVESALIAHTKTPEKRSKKGINHRIQGHTLSTAILNIYLVTSTNTERAKKVHASL